MSESTVALVLFLVIIGAVFVYVFRKKIITALIFIGIALIGFAFFKSSDYQIAGDIGEAETSLTQTVGDWWSALQSGYTKAQEFYAWFTKSQQLQTELAETDPGVVLTSLQSSYDYLKGIANNLATIELPTQEQLQSYSPAERESFLQNMSQFFAEANVQNQTVPSDEVPPGAVAIQSGLFTDDLALETAQGQVTQYRLDSGVLAIFVKELKLPYGPEQGLYLASVQDGQTVLSDEFLFVGPLKANQGNQLYFIPQTPGIEQYNTAFVYSPVLQQVYAIAPLR